MQKKLRLAIIIGLMSQSIYGMEKESELTGCLETYKELADHELSNMKVVPQWCYSTLETGQCALVGPLSPCVAVALKNLENNKTIVFHKQFSNNVHYLIDIAKAALEVTKMTNPNNLRGILFTQKNSHYDIPTSQLSGKSWKELHRNKSQESEISFIKSLLMKLFRIEDESQLKSNIFPGIEYVDLYQQSRAASSIFVDSDLNVYKVPREYESYLKNSEALVTDKNYLNHYCNALSYGEMFYRPDDNKGMLSLTSWASKITPDELKDLINVMPLETPDEIMSDGLQDHNENSKAELECNAGMKNFDYNNCYNFTTFIRR